MSQSLPREKSSTANLEERPSNNLPQQAPSEKSDAELWKEDLGEAGLNTQLLAGQLMKVISRRDDITKKLEDKGANMDVLIASVIDLMTANTLSKDGDMMPDNDARIRATELLSDLMGLRESKAQEMNAVKTVLETLGLKKGSGGVSVNFNFTEQLYGK